MLKCFLLIVQVAVFSASTSDTDMREVSMKICQTGLKIGKGPVYLQLSSYGELCGLTDRCEKEKNIQ